MRLRLVLDILRGLAPESLAETWDKAGLQLGKSSWEVERGLLCIDLTPAVMAEAIARRVDLVIAYHPPIFEALTGLTDSDWRQRMLLTAAQRRVAIYSPHTALDAAAGGLNDFLAGIFGPGKVRAIRPAVGDPGADRDYKLVTFVPADHVDPLRSALARAGAGSIGAYTQCSFSTPGQGTFYGQAGTHPRVGRRGRLERVPELRLEMVCPAQSVAQVLAALRRIHPYEEPAYDLYALSAGPSPKTAVGQGRIITLDRPLAAPEFLRRIKRRLGVQFLEIARPAKFKRVSCVGVCAGAGGELLAEAEEIDAYLTGEMRHHDVLAARERGVAVVLAGHTQTERPYLPHYRRRLERATGEAVTWTVSRADQPPTRMV